MSDIRTAWESVGKSSGGLRLTSWHVLVAVGAMLYAVYLRVNLPHGEAWAAMPNVWDGVVGVLGDPNLVCYGLLPVWLVQAFIEEDHYYQPEVVSRYRGKVHWLLAQYKRAIGSGLKYSGIILLVAIASSSSLPLSWGWSGYAEAEFVNQGRSGASALLMFPPIVVALVQWGYLVVGLAWFAMVIAALRLTGLRKAPRLIGVALLWLVTLVSLHADAHPNADISRLLLVVRDVDGWGGPGLGLAFALLTPAAVFFAWRLARRRPRLRVYPREVVVGGLVVAITSTSAANSSASATDGRILEVLYGGAFGQFTMEGYVSFSLLVLLPVLLYSAWLNDVLEGSILIRVIRQGSWVAWWVRDVAHGVVLIAAYLGSVFLLVAVLTGAFSSSWAGFDEGLLLLEAYQFVVNGTLASLTYMLLVVSARCASGRNAASLGALASFIVLGLPTLNGDGYLPFIMNGLGYVTGGWRAVVGVSGMLLAWSLVSTLVTFGVVRLRVRLGRCQ